MIFYITEKNIGDDVSKEQAEKVIDLLIKKGWNVEYGKKKNKAADMSEFGREEAIQDRFGDDFMECCALVLGE